jgi:hypothetical protein
MPKGVSGGKPTVALVSSGTAPCGNSKKQKELLQTKTESATDVITGEIYRQPCLDDFPEQQ